MVRDAGPASPVPIPGLPTRPVLRPGVHVVRRDDRHLQVGVDPPRRVVVPDEPDVRRALDDLVAGLAPRAATPRTHRVLADLVAADLVVDGTVDPRATRARAPVQVEAPGEVGDQVRRLLEAAGSPLARPGEAPAVALLVAAGEVRRAEVDRLVRADVPHLVASTTVDGLRLGPFVVPGHTACLRCVDAHLGEHDPRRALVLEQLADRRTPAPARAQDPVTQTLLAAWAVREVLRYVDGAEPATWSATLELGGSGDAELPRRRAWLRHPHCGCTWAEGLDAG